MTTPTPATVRDPAAHEQPTPPATLSTDQVETIVRHIAKAYLEVERGLRPPPHLKPHLTADAYDRLRRRPRQAFARGGPVGPRDLGPITSTTYPDTGRTYASLTAREQHDRWSGLVLQLQRETNGRMVVAELQRVPPRPHARQPATRHGRTLDEQIQWVEEERDLVDAALRTERKRPPTGLSDTAHIAPAAAHASRIAELDHELSMLQVQEQSRQAVEEQAHVIEPAPPNYITKLIGPRPREGWHRLQWDSAHDAIEDYRHRYDVEGSTALGPSAKDQGQRRDRDQLAQLLQVVQTRLRRGKARAQSREHNLKSAGGQARAREPDDRLQCRRLETHEVG